MPSLTEQFENLILAARNGSFGTAVLGTELATAVVRRHPLNFLVLKTNDDTEHALRLHLWDERFRFGQADFEIHDHIFDIDSFVVDGTVRQTIFDAEPDPAGDWNAFRVSYDESGSSLQSCERRLGLKTIREDTFKAGDRYQLPQGALHKLSLSGSSAATLVLTKTHGDASAVSVGPYGSSARMTTTRSIVCDPTGAPVTLASAGIGQIISAAIR